MRICIVGNSVGFKMRPPRARAADKTYSEILQSSGHEVRNVSKAGVTLQEQFALLDDEVLTFFPEVVILHHGVIEVFYRRTIRSLNNAAITNYYLNSVYRRHYQFTSPWFRVKHTLLRGANFATRSAAQLLGIGWQWQRPSRFMEIIERMLGVILKETGATIIVVGVTPPSQKAERDQPRLSRAVAEFNSALSTLCARMDERVVFLDVQSLCMEGCYEDLVPDGIHFSAAGHAAIAAKLLRILATARAPE